MHRPYHRPPAALCSVRSDNISIVPASLLPQKARYQALANRFPPGDILVILPRSTTTHQLLRTVVALFRDKGRIVHTRRVR